MGFEGNEVNTTFSSMIFSYEKTSPERTIGNSVAFCTDYVIAVISLLQALLVHFVINSR